MIKLLITDVDGTLVKEGTNDINPEYFDIIRQLHAKGIQVVAASGRPFPSLLALMKPVEDIIWFVADGGVLLRTTGELESVGHIPEGWARELWADISKVPDAEGLICGKQTVYVPKKDTFMTKTIEEGYKMHVTYQDGWSDFPSEPTGNISLFCEENIEEMAEKYIIPKWKDRLYLVIAGEWWLDCIMPGVNKGSALQRIMDLHGYKVEEIVAFGDNMNDIEMISLAGTGLAVSSARKELKAVADGEIENFETDGVLKEWKKYL